MSWSTHERWEHCSGCIITSHASLQWWVVHTHIEGVWPTYLHCGHSGINHQTLNIFVIIVKWFIIDKWRGESRETGRWGEILNIFVIFVTWCTIGRATGRWGEIINIKIVVIIGEWKGESASPSLLLLNPPYLFPLSGIRLLYPTHVCVCVVCVCVCVNIQYI